MPLSLDHDENCGNHNQNEKNPHASTLPVWRRRKVYERAANKKGRREPRPQFHGAAIPAAQGSTRPFRLDLGHSSRQVARPTGRALACQSK
jgi:hypothetical protein